MYFELKMTVTRLILKLQKNLNNIFSPKNYFSMGKFYKFLLSDEPFLSYCQKRAIAFAFYPQAVRICQNLTAWGVKSERECAFFTITQKALIWEQKLVKHTPTEFIFWGKILLSYFCSFKIKQTMAILISKYKWA